MGWGQLAHAALSGEHVKRKADDAMLSSDESELGAHPNACTTLARPNSCMGTLRALLRCATHVVVG